MRIASGNLASRIFCHRAFTEQKQLGVGLVGLTSLSKENSSGRVVAIKHLTTINSRKMEELFMNEFAIIANVKHPCILPFLGFITSAHHGAIPPALVSVYMENGSLDKVLKDQSIQKWTMTRKIKVLIGIAEGMKYLHNKHIIHRDLKPANILLNENYDAFVSDFGLSQFIPQRDFGGTPLYLAPEVIRRDEFNEKVDVYSYGVILFQVMTGIRPFADESNIENLMIRVADGERPEIPENVPKELTNLISKCWSDNIDERPSFNEISSILSNLKYPEFNLDNQQIKEYYDHIQEKSKNYKYEEESTFSSVFQKIIGCKQLFQAIWFLIRIMQLYGLTFSKPVDSFMSDVGPIFSWFNRFADMLVNAIFGIEEFTNAQMLVISSCPLVLLLFFVSFAGRRPSQNGIIQVFSIIFALPIGILFALICFGYREWWVYVILGLHLLLLLTYLVFKFTLSGFDDYESRIRSMFFVLSFPTSFYIDLANFACKRLKYDYFQENLWISFISTIFLTLMIIYMTNNIAFGVIVAIIAVILFIIYSIYRNVKHFGIDKKSIDKSFVSTARKLYLIFQTIFYIPSSEFIFRIIREDKDIMSIPLITYSLLFSILMTILFLVYFSYRAISYRNMLNPYCFRFIMNNCSTFLGFNCSDLKAMFLWFEPIDSIVRFLFAGLTVYNLNWYALGMNLIEALFVIIARPYLCPSDNILCAGEMIVLAVANGFSAAEFGGLVFKKWYAYLIVAIAFLPIIVSLIVFFIFELNNEGKYIDADITRLLKKKNNSISNSTSSKKNPIPIDSNFNATSSFVPPEIELNDYGYDDDNDELGLNYSGTRIIALVEDDPRFQKFFNTVFQQFHLLVGFPLLTIYLFWNNMVKINPK
ncbi:hypothetical protein TRFO_39576 [Tritrichomonas foetus]|uniref:Protein kinase domain-containing protein n=1 Tax=Tritrichomonas foetus TaxID=1144522 RepID=A0A1J4J4F1_9EUKA|nr:hypothetical protein TRFO_39576 [Tritrichomonas foetus]|eukprot:OHS94246.1 hypothetical protein TRFO_39576 [Tritrichomonas foetus]